MTIEVGDRVWLFVYGTLKEHGRLYVGYEDAIVKGEIIKGTMYSLKHFPAIKLDGKGEIHGELHQIPELYLGIYDQIEGEGVLYKRVEVETNSGMSAYTYEYMHPVDDLEEVEDGYWRP